MPTLSIIIPCYYNEANIPVTWNTLQAMESDLPEELNVQYVFVDDGSKDKTLEALLAVKKANPSRVVVIKLAGNVGSYNAVVAGMEHATGDCNVIISADLQDPPELIKTMYGHWLGGFKLVIGHRIDRDESTLQKAFSNSFHALMKKFALKNVPDGGFDFVLFDAQIRSEILKLGERNTNVFYLMAWMGYQYVSIPYRRKKREIGKSRWTLAAKVKLLIDSFLSFSFVPLRFITVCGIIFGIIALIYAFFIILFKIYGGIPVEGWSAIMVVVLFVSSFQMIALGIIGEYVWRTLDASKKRPLYIVEEVF